MIELIVYITTMAITPGPNTIASLANASSKGFIKGVSLNFGMLLGITILSTLSYLIISSIILYLPQIEPIMQILGAMYIIYLAIHLIRKRDVSFSFGKTGGFRAGVLMQLVNMKVMLLCLTAISTFILSMSKSWLEGYILSLLIPIICFLSGLVWALGGQILSRIYKEHIKVFNILFALSLLVLAIKSLYKVIN